jgi:hypothetical protein
MSLRWSLPFVPCALLAASAPAAALAATAIRLETTGQLPFSPEELEQAAGARLAMSAEAGAPVVMVGPADDAGVHVRMGARTTAVVVGARAGLAAARIVALAIAELAADAPDGASPPKPEPAPPTPDAAARKAPPAIAAPAAPPPAAPPPHPLPRISVTLGASKGMDASEPFTGTCEADVTLPLRHFDVVATLGIWDAPTRNAGRADEASFVAGVARASAGWRAGPLQLLLGPFVAPYRIEGGVNHTGVLAGGGAMLRAGHRLAAAPRVSVFGSVRVDAFVNRVSVSLVGSEPSFASPRLAAAVGVGVGWDLGS